MMKLCTWCLVLLVCIFQIYCVTVPAGQPNSKNHTNAHRHSRTHHRQQHQHRQKMVETTTKVSSQLPTTPITTGKPSILTSDIKRKLDKHANQKEIITSIIVVPMRPCPEGERRTEGGFSDIPDQSQKCLLVILSLVVLGLIIALVVIFLRNSDPLPAEQQNTTHHHNADLTDDHQQIQVKQQSVKPIQITRGTPSSILTSYVKMKLDKHANQEATIKSIISVHKRRGSSNKKLFPRKKVVG